MPDPSGWGSRFERAILLYSAVNGRTSLEHVGELIAQAEGRETPYARATVSEWVKEKNEPTLKTFEAMAQVFDCDPWWIAWGVGRAPENPVAKHIKPAPRSTPAKSSRGRG